ncbi:cell division control protein 6 homolog [Drosophila guanche]|uniref:Cell division control protein n=1 Tax=Drosophila guanche TaxID=7266 RepID=A0A3B0J6P1_DROGU|nr:cell division control protein 6 homolog [Drosophila guanche]SPP77395.1 blast:Cell division control protein 6 homolog [Drosophila guanche]
MAAVRRSTRLSSISKSTAASSPLPQSPRTTTTTSRRSEIWRRRQTKATEDSDDEDRDDIISVVSENNENRDLLNKMERTARRRTAPPQVIQEEPKTPRSSSSSSSKKSAAAKAASLARRVQANEEAVLAFNKSTDEDEDEEDAHSHVSPPKQRRLKPLPQHLISPSRLLDRLSIDERQEPEQKTEKNHQVEEQKEKEPEPAPSPPRNKYQNARRVLNSAETQNLPGREAQLLELREYFTSHLESQTSGSLYVSGQPGTGKTACLSLLLRDPEFSKRLQRVYINCTSIASVGAVYKKLCAELQLKPAGRTERDHLEAIQRHLRTAKRMLLLVLDEIDQLCTTRQAVLYTIFEWPALPGARILLVGIANSLDLTDRTLTRLNARCELKPRLMHFPSYTKQQIVEIFKSRLAEADVLDVFPPVTLQLLAAKVSAISGDVRRALDIGRRVVEIAEQQKRDGEREFNLKALELADGQEKEEPKQDTMKPVQVTQVAAVLNKVYGASQNLEEDIEAAFPLQQKLMLCSLVLMLRNERNKDISMGRLHEVYRRVCAKRNILALDQAEFTGTVDLVETRGILRIMRKKEPRLSKIMLQWDEEEVHAALSDKQLIASILNDTACLNR